MKQLTRAERETIIRWDADDRTVNIYTADPAVMRRLARLGYDPQPNGHLGWECKGPEGCITVRTKKTVGAKVRKNRGFGRPTQPGTPTASPSTP